MDMRCPVLIGKGVIYMEKLFLNMAASGWLLGIVFVLFIIGFACKIAAGMFYDEALENIECIHMIKEGIVHNVVEAYRGYTKEGACVNNTRAYVDNELHKWTRWGIKVEKYENIGDVFAAVCVFIGALFDMVMLIEGTFSTDNMQDIMRYVYLYSLLVVMFIIVIKAWSSFAGINRKREELSNAIVNYIDNQYENPAPYMSMDIEQKAEEHVQDNVDKMSGQSKKRRRKKTSQQNNQVNKAEASNQKNKTQKAEASQQSDKNNKKNVNKSLGNDMKCNVIVTIKESESEENSERNKKEEEDKEKDKELVIAQVLNEFL